MTLRLLKNSVPEEAHLTISYSKLITYLMCPEKFAHNYVWGTPPEHTPMALLFGRAIHKAAETYYSALKDTGEIVTVDHLIATFEKEYDQAVKAAKIQILLKKGESIASVRGMGQELLKVFHAEIRPQTIVAVELPFSVSVPDLDNGGNLDVRLEGVMDLVEKDAEGTYLISELKTAAQRFTSHKLDQDAQPTVYSFALSQMRLATDNNSTLVRYDVLLKTKKAEMESYFVQRTEADHQRLVQLINQILKAIDHRIFYRNTTGWMCTDCQFRKACLGG